MTDEDPKVRDPRPCISAVLASHRPHRKGKCPWCGLEQTERTPVRKLLRVMHEACSYELNIIKSPNAARDAVWKRDGGICAECHEDWGDKYRMRPAHPIGHRWHITLVNDCGWDYGGSPEKHPYVRLVAISLWHVDHKVPLWKVRHMPPLERIAYFKLANLVTLCERCHLHKCRAETAERTKLRTLPPAEKPSKQKKFTWPKGRKLQGRGFQKGHRPMRGKS